LIIGCGKRIKRAAFAAGNNPLRLAKLVVFERDTGELPSRSVGFGTDPAPRRHSAA
jgi:hypothetical protein